MFNPKVFKELYIVSRPRQWTKNLIIYAAFLFTFNFEFSYFIFSTKAFICFCLISSTIYTLNDILDRNSDRLHNTKKLRPIASGKLSLKIAKIYFFSILILSLSLSLSVSKLLFCSVLSYFVIQLMYCLGLKRQPILDIFCIAIGFILRAVSGISFDGVLPSHWFLLSLGLLALFLAIEKRKAELRTTITTGVVTRKVLLRYSLPLLQRLESLVACSAFMSYTLWSSGPSLNGASTSWMLLSIPFVLAGIFRYQLLSDPEEFQRRKIIFPDKNTENPEEILLTDKGIQLSIIGWLITVLLVGISSKFF